MHGLHQICSMRTGLVSMTEALDEAAEHRKKARFTLVIVQQPAGASLRLCGSQAAWPSYSSLLQLQACTCAI